MAILDKTVCGEALRHSFPENWETQHGILIKTLCIVHMHYVYCCNACVLHEYWPLVACVVLCTVACFKIACNRKFSFFYFCSKKRVLNYHVWPRSRVMEHPFTFIHLSWYPFIYMCIMYTFILHCIQWISICIINSTNVPTHIYH